VYQIFIAEYMKETKLNVQGEKCPFPLMKAKKILKDMSSGDMLTVISTDPNTENDFKRFCSGGKYKIITLTKYEDNLEFLIIKV
jgi:tRNA 2-thiouridine synthesizing protein A